MTDLIISLLNVTIELSSIFLAEARISETGKFPQVAAIQWQSLKRLLSMTQLWSGSACACVK